MDEFEQNKLFASGEYTKEHLSTVLDTLLLIHSFGKYLFIFCYVPGIVLREYSVYKVKNKTWYGR